MTKAPTLLLAVGSDHAGFDLKNDLVQWLRQKGHTAEDVGPHAYDPSDDYPDYARMVGNAIMAGTVERGVLVCGSGVGASIAASKMPGVRAAMCHDTYSAHQGVEHDDMNVLCVGARIVGIELAKEIVAAFLGARFTGEERHLRRLHKVIAIEEAFSVKPATH